MFGRYVGKIGACGGLTLLQRAMGILRLPGITAHMYSPNVSNYLLSDGSTGLTTVDGVTGLVLDSVGGVGAELVAVTPVFTSIDASFVASSSSGALTAAPAGTLVGYLPATGPLFVGGKTYQITVIVSAYVSGAVALLFFGGGTESQQITGTTTFTVRLDAGATGVAYVYTKAAGTTLTIDSISAREVAGNHAGQPTTAAKPILKFTSGKYWWDFDGVDDALTRTFAAGYESATVINAAPGGQVTLTGQNIVGAYPITTDTYGQIIVKESASLSAGQIAVLQAYANSLAGV